jgi:hypothetical protein
MTMPVRQVTIANTPGLYECFPCLARTQSGTLITVYRESDHHSADAFTRLVVRQSRDEGETWSDARQIITSERREGILFKWNCPRIGQLAEGRLWLLCDGYPQPPGEAQCENSRIFFWWSEDEGRSWSAPVQTPIHGIVPDRLLVTQSGAWLLATHLDHPDRGYYTQEVFRSTDAGRTWDGPITVCERPGLKVCEGSILQLPSDGLLVCTMRENSGLGLPAYKCFSRDDGRSWEGPYETNLMGCHRPVTGLVPDGRILTTYRLTTRGWIGSAKNFLAMLETEESLRETDPLKTGGIILPIDHDRWPQPDSGYSGWTVLPDGRLFCVTYIRDDSPQAQIRGYWFSLDDF